MLHVKLISLKVSRFQNLNRNLNPCHASRVIPRRSHFRPLRTGGNSHHEAATTSAKAV